MLLQLSNANLAIQGHVPKEPSQMTMWRSQMHLHAVTENGLRQQHQEITRQEQNESIQSTAAFIAGYNYVLHSLCVHK